MTRPTRSTAAAPSTHIYAPGIVPTVALEEYVATGAPDVAVDRISGGVVASYVTDDPRVTLGLVAHPGLCDPALVPDGFTPVVVRGHIDQPARSTYAWHHTPAWDPATLGLNGVVPVDRAALWRGWVWQPPLVVAVLDASEPGRYAHQALSGIVPPWAPLLPRPVVVTPTDADRARERLGVDLTPGLVHVLAGGAPRRVLATQALTDTSVTQLPLAYARALTEAPTLDDLVQAATAAA